MDISVAEDLVRVGVLRLSSLARLHTLHRPQANPACLIAGRQRLQSLDGKPDHGRGRGPFAWLKRMAGGAAAGLPATALLPGSALAGVPSLSKLVVFGDSRSGSGKSGLLGGGQFTPLPYDQNRASNGK